jgi:hypothetical protein
MQEQISSLISSLEWLDKLQAYKPPTGMTLGEACAKLAILVPENITGAEIVLTVSLDRDDGEPTASYRAQWTSRSTYRSESVGPCPSLAELIDHVRAKLQPTGTLAEAEAAIGTVSETHEASNPYCPCGSCKRSLASADF